MFILFVIGFIIAFTLWSEYYKRFWYRNLKVTLHFTNEAIYEGEKTKLVEIVENRKKMPIPLLEVGFHTKKELQFQNVDNTYISDNTYKRDIFACLGKQKITRNIDVKGKKRGFYEINNIDINSFSVLHDKKYSRNIECKTSLFVYPARVKVNDILVSCERMTGTLQCSKHLYEDPFSFRSIRDYMIDDPMKTINWNASARTGKLMVNTFDSVLTQRAFIFLDLEDSSILKHEHLIEYCISLAATLGYKFLNKNMEMAITSNSSIELDFASGKKQHSRLERMLALYNDKDAIIKESIDTVIDSFDSKFERDTDFVFILISKNNNEKVLESYKKFLGDERQGIWICPYTMGDKKELSDVEELKKNIHSGNMKFIAREVAK